MASEDLTPGLEDIPDPQPVTSWGAETIGVQNFLLNLDACRGRRVRKFAEAGREDEGIAEPGVGDSGSRLLQGALADAAQSSYAERRSGMKTFTLDEAQSLLPVLESLLNRALESKMAAQAAEAKLASLAQRIYVAGGMRVDVSAVAQQRAEVEAQMQRVRETVGEIDSIGVQVKDLETGLLDFPFRLDDEVVLLCWRKGEAAIEHWHTMDAGFQGRQPVDERFRRRSAQGGRPN